MSKTEVYPTQLSENLKQILKENDINASKLADDLNLPLMTIRRLLLGQTSDPRLSTLKMIADYFNISIDILISQNKDKYAKATDLKPILIPLLSWDLLESVSSLEEIIFSKCSEWYPFTSNINNSVGEKAYAVLSRPSMSPRFPQGTVFIFDPDISPQDGDLVLVKIKNELTLRELIINPPEWYLQSVIPDFPTIKFNSIDYKIIGVNVLTLLYNRKR